MTRLLVVALALAATAARADTIVIESYTGERPADADRIVVSLRALLERAGASARPAAILARHGERLPLPGVTDRSLDAAALAEQVDRGFRAGLRGEFALAVTELEHALAAARENPSLVVADPRSRTWLGRALVGLAFAKSRLGDPAAAGELMAEHARSFPDDPVTRDAFGPEAARLYAAARAALDRSGSLAIAVSEPDAQIYVNEVGRGRGSLALDTPPGTYRVLVEAGGLGRRYTVAVEPGRRARLAIRWELDARFTATPTWLGAVWPGDDRIAELVQPLLASGALDTIVVVGTADRRATGRVYRRGGLARSGSARVDDLAALARFLATGARSPAILTLAGAPVAPPQRPRWPRWLAGPLGAGALAAITGGAYLVHLHDRGTCDAVEPVQCRQLHRTAAGGWTLIGTGTVALGAGIYWIARGTF